MKVRRQQTVFRGCEDEVADQAKHVPVLAAVYHHVIEANDMRQQKFIEDFFCRFCCLAGNCLAAAYPGRQDF